MRLSIALILLFVVLSTPVVDAQDAPVETPAVQPKPTEAPQTPDPTPNADFSNYAKTDEEAETLGPKNKEFITRYGAFRDVVKTLNALKAEYPGAKEQRQIEIEKEYMEKYPEGEKLNREMREIGLEAFKEAPNRNPAVSNYIYNLISWEFYRDNYEECVRIFKTLAPHGIPKEAEIYYAFAGLAAMMTMDLDEAEAWLKTATDNGQLEELMKLYAKTEKGREQVMSLEGLYMRIPKFKEDWAKEQAVRKAETEAGEKDPAKKLPRVLLKTSKGDIVIELFENEAPNTVANFVSLVEKGFYNGTVFHRVLPMFMAQGGDPTGTGMGGPGYSIDCENKAPDARKHFRGTLSMAHAGANTGGSQFFLTFIPTYFLDRETRPPGHTVFGRVVEGLEVLADIQRVDPSDEEAVIPVRDKIEEAKVLNKRDREYAPIKNANRR